MNKSVFHSKTFLVGSLVAGLVGTAAFASVAFAYGISGLGMAPMFGALYYSTVADIVLSVGIINGAKTLMDYNFMEKFGKKHKQANELYEELNNQNVKLNQLIDSHVQLTDKKSRLYSYINIMKEQNIYHSMMEKANNLTEKERKALQKFVNLKAVLFDVNYYDPDLQNMLNASQQPTKESKKKQTKVAVKETTTKETVMEKKETHKPAHSFAAAEEKTM